MNVLSISTAHDAGAALISEGRILSAVNEERITRKKSQSGFPIHSINAVLETAGIGPEDVDHIVIPTFDKLYDLRKNVIPNFTASVLAGSKGLPLDTRMKQFGYYASKIAANYTYTILGKWGVVRRLQKLFPDATISRVEHHIGHASTAFYTSGFDEALIFTADQQGDFVSLMVAYGKGSNIEVVSRTFYPNSLGVYYQYLTAELGFTPSRHEGKIVGLAAYGDKNSPAYNEMYDLLKCSNGTIVAPCMGIRFRPLIRRLQKKYSREDISAVFQRRLEEVVIQLIDGYVRRYKISNITLAGGVFANVKLNQRVLEIDGVESIFVFPNMSDGGISVGGALYHDINNNGSTPHRLSHVYLDREFTEDEMRSALEKEGLNFEYDPEIDKTVARLITEGHVVARFSGPMEYGPRALGNRSILYHAKDPSVNDWLNKRLGRTEFMPFAPVTLLEYADRCYKGLKGAEFTAKFMTVTFDCTDYMKDVSPAAVHVDGTARPQLLERNDNPGYYNILEEYYKLTGIPSIINTSFNMHEEPIVRTPEDAIRAFLLGHLDFMAMGNFLVRNRDTDKGKFRRISLESSKN
jgi:carbamoyltransferase